MISFPAKLDQLAAPPMQQVAQDPCKHGELSKLLRREKLYSNQLQQLHRELAEQEAGPESIKRLNRSVSNSWKKKADAFEENES